MHISMIFLVLLFISFCIQRIIDEVFEPSSLTMELLLDSSFRRNPNINQLSLSDSIKLRYLENIGINFDQIQEQMANFSQENPTERLIKNSIMMNSKHYIFMENRENDFFYLLNIYESQMMGRRLLHTWYSCNLVKLLKSKKNEIFFFRCFIL